MVLENYLLKSTFGVYVLFCVLDCSISYYHYYHYYWLCPQNLKWSPAEWPMVVRLCVCIYIRAKSRIDISLYLKFEIDESVFNFLVVGKWLGEQTDAEERVVGWSKQNECYWSATNLNCGWNCVWFLFCGEIGIVWGFGPNKPGIYASTQHPLWHIIHLLILTSPAAIVELK